MARSNQPPSRSGSEITYNGYTFPLTSQVKFVSKPVYSNNDRSVKHIEYSVTVESLVSNKDTTPVDSLTSEPSTDTLLDDLRVLLTQPRQTLTIKAIGCGDLTIVPATNAITSSVSQRYDRQNGPRPRVLAWEQVGAERAARIVWSCTAVAVECSDITKVNHINDYSYEMNYTLDGRGMTTISRNGVFEIPQTAAVAGGSGVVPLTPDGIRPIIEKNLRKPDNFKRVSSDWRISSDKRTLTFSIVDTEVPSDNPYPVGVTNITVNHSMSSGLMKKGFQSWDNTLSGSVTVAPRESKALAYFAFLTVINSRIRPLWDKAARVKWKGLGINTKGLVPIVTSIEIDEELLGRTVSFSVEYTFVADLAKNAIKIAGMFEPTEGSSWESWSNSLNENVNDARGAAKLIDHSYVYEAVTQCAGQSNTPSLQQKFSSNFSQSRTLASVFDVSCPPKDQSWVQYQNAVVMSNQRQVKRHRRYEEVQTGIPTALQIVTTGTKVDPAVVDGQSSGQDHFQVMGKASSTLVMEGYAMRFREPTNPPNLISYGGKKVEFIDEDVQSQVIQASSDCPLYYTAWRKEYYLTQTPTGDVNSSTGISESPEDRQGVLESPGPNGLTIVGKNQI